MRLFHITSPLSAIKIVKQGRFNPLSSAGDNGLNCFCGDKTLYNMKQCFEGEGARLILEWSGAVENTNPYTSSSPLQIDILHIQLPWRCFIPSGTNEKYIRVIGIYFSKDELNSVIESPSWYKYLPAAVETRLIRRNKLILIRELRQRYRKSDLFLKIIQK